MKFNVGDKVRVRIGLMPGIHYYMDNGVNYSGVAPEMRVLGGKVLTISVANPGFYKTLETERYLWTDEMFEPDVVSTDAELSACTELEADLLISLTWGGNAIKCGDTAKKLYELGYRKRSKDDIKVKCSNCEFYDKARARCDHPQLDYDDSVSAVWLDMQPDDSCSRWKEKKPDNNYSGKIVCIECRNDAFVPGKMYTCTDGCLRGEDDELWGFVRKPNNDKSSIFCLLGSETDPHAKFIVVSN